jgi:tRNA threonylcarbamoyladenosine biosynthesis protein TsaB
MSGLLAFELSGPVATVALAHGGRVFTHDFTALRGRALIPALAHLLAEADCPRTGLRGVLCGTGPGSYTGLRIAAAAARALAFALDVPVAGVPSLHAAALDAPEGEPVHLLLDAYRNEVYHAELVVHPDRIEELRGPQVLPRDAARDAVPTAALLIGDPALLDGADVQVVRDRVAPTAAQALEVARRYGVDEDGGGIGTLPTPDPLYLRPAAYPPHA